MNAPATNAIAKRQIRLYVDLPYPDETWGSFVDRVAGFYRCDRKGLMAQLTGTWPHEPWCTIDFDRDMPQGVYEAFREALQVSHDEFPPGERGVTRDSLPGHRRHDYCPLCFLDDLRAGRTPYFRFQWSIPLLTYCQEHQTPLVPWRMRRARDERILPWLWLSRPRSKVATACPWLQEDVAYVRQYSKSHLNRTHPFSLVRRLTEVAVGVDVQACKWRFNSNVAVGFHLEGLITIGASNCATGNSLAAVLRPTGDERLFGAPRKPITWEARYQNRCWTSSDVTVAFRRALMWFAARTVLGCRAPIEVANGVVVEPGSWERWWIEVVRPLTTGILANRVKGEENYMRMCENHGQWNLF